VQPCNRLETFLDAFWCWTAGGPAAGHHRQRSRLSSDGMLAYKPCAASVDRNEALGFASPLPDGAVWTQMSAEIQAAVTPLSPLPLVLQSVACCDPFAATGHHIVATPVAVASSGQLPMTYFAAALSPGSVFLPPGAAVVPPGPGGALPPVASLPPPPGSTAVYHRFDSDVQQQQEHHHRRTASSDAAPQRPSVYHTHGHTASIDLSISSHHQPSASVSEAASSGVSGYTPLPVPSDAVLVRPRMPMLSAVGSTDNTPTPPPAGAEATHPVLLLSAPPAALHDSATGDEQTRVQASRASSPVGPVSVYGGGFYAPPVHTDDTAAGAATPTPTSCCPYCAVGFPQNGHMFYQATGPSYLIRSFSPTMTSLGVPGNLSGGSSAGPRVPGTAAVVHLPNTVYHRVPPQSSASVPGTSSAPGLQLGQVPGAARVSHSPGRPPPSPQHHGHHYHRRCHSVSVTASPSSFVAGPSTPTVVGNVPGTSSGVHGVPSVPGTPSVAGASAAPGALSVPGASSVFGIVPGTSPAAPGAPGVRVRTARPALSCANCGRVGHIQLDCREPTIDSVLNTRTSVCHSVLLWGRPS